MEFNSRKSVNDKLNKYDYLAKDEEYIEVTEWANGEGYDITIGGGSNYKQFSLTDGELEAIKYLTKSLEIQ